MRPLLITLILCVSAWTAVGDVGHARAKPLGRLVAGKHHKRGILSGVPPYKLGHDIPLVTHSVVKPLVVSYPPTAAVAAVKVPLTNPLLQHYPVPVGHKVPVPHPHYGLKFPHTKVVVPKPDHHFHHHHHHVAPKPVVPVVPVVPVPPPAPLPQPAVAHPLPAPQVLVQPAPLLPAPPVHAHPVPLAPVLQSHPVPLAPPPVFPPSPLHLKPLLPAAAVALPPAHGFPAPIVPQLPYVIRPGGSVQTSVFATFPRYPLLNYQSPLIPFPPALPAGQVSSVQPVFLERPQLPQYHYIPQAAAHGAVYEQHTPSVAVEHTPALIHPTSAVPPSVIPLHPPQELPQPGVQVHATQAAFPQLDIPLHPTQAALPQPAVHLQPTQPSVHLDHDGWSPVPAQPHDVAPGQGLDGQFAQQGPQFTQEQGTQVYEQHTGDQYHDFQHQLQQHIQQQLEQAQYEQQLNNQQHQLNQEYGVPQQVGQQNDYFQQNQNFANQDQYAQHGQDFSQQGQDFSQQGQEFGQHGQDFGQQDFSQNDYNVGQPGQEYGAPQQGLEGRSGEQGEPADQGQQQFRNHIPLGLQPPIDRPLEHFQ